jgi:phosphoenolpyruvate-protein kinase (PTS system EI component)
MILHGQGLCPGFFEGRAHVLDAAAWIAAAERVKPRHGSEREMERLRVAQVLAFAQLEQVQAQLSHQGRKEDAEIFAAHLLMMRDPVLQQRVEQGIAANGLSAEAAVARSCCWYPCWTAWIRCDA